VPAVKPAICPLAAGCLDHNGQLRFVTEFARLLISAGKEEATKAYVSPEEPTLSPTQSAFYKTWFEESVDVTQQVGF
jgi:hypothetical protein